MSSAVCFSLLPREEALLRAVLPQLSVLRLRSIAQAKDPSQQSRGSHQDLLLPLLELQLVFVNMYIHVCMYVFIWGGRLYYFLRFALEGISKVSKS